jgi:tetratricopeptide (TPR) repeat protein
MQPSTASSVDPTMIFAKHRVRTSLLLSAVVVTIVGVILLRDRGHVGLDELIVAHANRGTAAMNRSCPVKLSGGLCRAPHVAAMPHKRIGPVQPERCGPENIGQATVARASDDVVRALAELHTAVALYEQVGGKTGGNEAGALHAYVEARLAIADVELERYFAMPFPTSSSFDPTDQPLAVQSKQRFAEWLSSKQQVADGLRARYRAIAAANDPIGAVGAAARLGQIPQNQSDTLLASPIPASVRTGEHADDSVDAYCDALVGAAEPFEQQTVEAFASCVKLAAQSGALDTNLARLRGVAEWSQLCASELAQRQPDKFPMVNEMLASTDSDPWELVRLQIRLGNYQKVIDLLAALPPAYDQQDMLGVAFRGQAKLAAAEAAYRRAIELEPARPEAFYNLGLLLKDYIATTAPDLDQASVAYHKAIPLLEQSAARATGALALDAAEQIALTRKTIAQVEAFQRGR